MNVGKEVTGFFSTLLGISKRKKLSEFQRKKLGNEFHTFYDVNKDGHLQWEDFDIARENICKLNGWKKDNPKYAATKQLFIELWRDLMDNGDKNVDGIVTEDEWVKMWEQYLPLKPKEQKKEKATDTSNITRSKTTTAAATPTTETAKTTTEEDQDDPVKVELDVPPFLEKYIEYKFNLLDRTGNGSLDIEEFEYVLGMFDIPAKNARAAFTMLSQDGKRKVDFAYFRELAIEFYNTDEPGALGNFINGKLLYE